VADRLLLVGDGMVKPYDGDLDDYRKLLLDRARPVSKEAREAAKRGDDRKDRADARAVVAPLRKQAKDAEALLARLGSERQKIEAELADPRLYAKGRAQDIITARMRLSVVQREAKAAETKWLEAEEALEAASV